MQVLVNDDPAISDKIHAYSEALIIKQQTALFGRTWHNKGPNIHPNLLLYEPLQLYDDKMPPAMLLMKKLLMQLRENTVRKT